MLESRQISGPFCPIICELESRKSCTLRPRRALNPINFGSPTSGDGAAARRRRFAGRFSNVRAAIGGIDSIECAMSDNAILSDMQTRRRARRFRRFLLAKSAAAGYRSGMLARPDSSAIPGPSAASAAAFPAWARAVHAAGNRGRSRVSRRRRARPARCDRSRKPALGRRLAPAPRPASRGRQRARAGRNEDEAALRDALHLTRPAPIPDRRDAGCWPGARSRPDQPGNGAPRSRSPPRPWTSPATTRCKRRSRPREACAAGTSPGAVRRREDVRARAAAPSGATAAGHGELLAGWLADAVLAQRLKWPFALPLLAAPLFAAAGRRATAERGDGDATTRVLFG